jgi:Skp family chaperone for outer membrane proteins
MKIFRTTLPALLLLTFLSGSALAQGKIATVDLQKLFDNYYKTKLAAASLDESRAQLAKDEKGMTDDFKKANDDYQQLLSQASDMALAADERTRRQQAADDKLKQLQANKAAIDQFDRQANVTLGEKRQRMRDNILVDIKAVVSAKAKAAGCSLVIDSAAITPNSTQVLVYNSGDNDLTDVILAQLNAGAPIDVTRPAMTTLAPPSLSSTNVP